MDEDTAAFYEQHAAACAVRWNAIDETTGIAQFFETAFAPGGAVLDIGCGSGRDLNILRRAGFDAYGIEPVAGLRAELAAQRPELVDVVAGGSLPTVELPPAWPAAFDGIVCSAVLMHLSSDDLRAAMQRIADLVAPRGRLLCSVPASRPGIVDGRDANGRLFSGIRADELAAIGRGVGFAPVQVLTDWGDRQGRDGHTWDSLLLERSATRSGC